MLDWSQPYSKMVYVAVAIVLAAIVAAAWLLAASDRLRKWVLFVPRIAVLSALLLILLNPVRLSRHQLPPRPSNVVYLVDCSRSMALGRPQSRINAAKMAIYNADTRVTGGDRPRVQLYRFGSQLAAAPSAPQLNAEEPATRLQNALEGLPTRFPLDIPKAVVVFSDGTTDETSGLREIAAGYREMGVPIHVFPVGDKDLRGDVAIQELIVPRRVAAGTKVPVRTTIRGNGFEGERIKLTVRSADYPDRPPLASLPITLSEQPQRFELVVEADSQSPRLVLEADAVQGEAVLENNRVPFQLSAGDRKIRVLYMEGSTGGEYRWIQDALTEDPDIECLSMVVNQQYAARPRLMRVDDPYRGFPTTREELFKFDIIICSDISQGAFTREQMDWVVELVSQRGGGFVMIGGHTSFGSGNWDQTSWDKLIPVDMTGGTVGRGYINSTFHVAIPEDAMDHPVWRLLDDPEQNRRALEKMPPFYGTNLIKRLKPAATMLGKTSRPLPQVGVMPVFASESYGRGRTFALSSDSTYAWGTDFESKWGEGDNRYFRKFWRNTARWLSENSIAGNKRLLVETDKIIYRPNEPIEIEATAFDAQFHETSKYELQATLRVTEEDSDENPRITLEPQTTVQRYQGNVLARMPRRTVAADQEYSTLHTAVLEVVARDKQVEVARVELDVQILEDSSELAKPQATPTNLQLLAAESGGLVLPRADQLADVLRTYPAAPGEVLVQRTPVWDHPIFWVGLLLLLACEWALRRRFGFG